MINAALVGIDFGKTDFEASLEELSLLASSACPAVTLTGRRSSPDAKMFIGSGKAEELRLACDAHNVEIVIFNHALAPAQQRNLEQALNRRVVDRTSLILDIFAQRARSHEGKLQVGSRSFSTCRRGSFAHGPTLSGRRVVSACAAPVKPSSKPTAG